MIPTKLIDGLLSELRCRGIRIVYDGDDKMHLAGKVEGIQSDEKVMAALKAFRPYILAKIKAEVENNDTEPETEENPTQAPARPEWETCRECLAVVHQSMTTEDALILCDRNGARASKGIPATNRCPYRPPISSGHGGG